MFILSFILVACLIPNPIKKRNKSYLQRMPQSLILYKARSVDFGNTNIELQNDYNLSCYLSVDEDSVEISTDYKLNINLTDQDKNTYEVELIVFVTNLDEDYKIAEFKFQKEIKLNMEIDKINSIDLNDKFQIDLDTYNKGIKYFMQSID